MMGIHVVSESREVGGPDTRARLVWIDGFGIVLGIIAPVEGFGEV